MVRVGKSFITYAGHEPRFEHHAVQGVRRRPHKVIATRWQLELRLADRYIGVCRLKPVEDRRPA